MDIKQAAEKLNGSSYGLEGSDSLWKQMKSAGLVAAFGASDDLLEFRGAIYDEIGAYDGTTVYLDSNGLIVRRCDNEDCPHDKERMDRARSSANRVKAEWCPKSLSCSWLITVDVPHETFDVMEDGELYCRGVVFSLKDCRTLDKRAVA